MRATPLSRSSRRHARPWTGKIDVAFAFFTGEFNQNASRRWRRISWLELDAQAIIGCSAEGVIEADREVEPRTRRAVAARRPAARRAPPHHFMFLASTPGEAFLTRPGRALIGQRFGCGDDTRANHRLRRSVPVRSMTPKLASRRLDTALPNIPLIGGMASSARQPGENVLLRNDEAYQQGFVGLCVSGPLDVQTLVSQGCRPIGKPMVITKSHDNMIEQLRAKPRGQGSAGNGQRAWKNPSAKQPAPTGFFVGRAISEYKERFGRGDFLVRNVMGVDEESGAIAVAEYVKTGQTVQFLKAQARCGNRRRRSVAASGRRQAPQDEPGRARCSSVATGAGRACSPCRVTTLMRLTR